MTRKCFLKILPFSFVIAFSLVRFPVSFRMMGFEERVERRFWVHRNEVIVSNVKFLSLRTDSLQEHMLLGAMSLVEGKFGL